MKCKTGLYQSSLTHMAGVVYKNDFLEVPSGGAVNDTVHCPQEDGWPFIVERYYNTD